MLRLRAGESRLALASSSPRSSPRRPSRAGAWRNAKPAWRKVDDAAEGGMENDVNAMLLACFSDFAIAIQARERREGEV